MEVVWPCEKDRSSTGKKDIIYPQPTPKTQVLTSSFA